jgi:hypothetical protein
MGVDGESRASIEPKLSPTFNTAAVVNINDGGATGGRGRFLSHFGTVWKGRRKDDYIGTIVSNGRKGVAYVC